MYASINKEASCAQRMCNVCKVNKSVQNCRTQRLFIFAGRVVKRFKSCAYSVEMFVEVTFRKLYKIHSLKHICNDSMRIVSAQPTCTF